MGKQNIQEWLKHAHETGLSDMEIQGHLKKLGLTDSQINQVLVSGYSQPVKKSSLTPEKIISSTGEISKPDKTAKECLQENTKLQLYNKIIIGWLITYLILRIAYGIVLALAYRNTGTIGALGITLFFLIPGILVLIGLIKQKKWAYWLYFLGLIFSLTTFTQATTVFSLIMGIILTFGSLAILVLTIKLYRRLFLLK